MLAAKRNPRPVDGEFFPVAPLPDEDHRARAAVRRHSAECGADRPVHRSPGNAIALLSPVTGVHNGGVLSLCAQREREQCDCPSQLYLDVVVILSGSATRRAYESRYANHDWGSGKSPLAVQPAPI